jgi:hypothetical protein
MWPGTAGVSVCKPVRRTGGRAPREGIKKNLIRFCPVGARCGACPLKKLRLDYEAGDSPEGEPGIMVFLANVGVKDNRKIPVSRPVRTRRSSTEPLVCSKQDRFAAPSWLTFPEEESKQVPEPFRPLDYVLCAVAFFLVGIATVPLMTAWIR